MLADGASELHSAVSEWGNAVKFCIAIPTGLALASAIMCADTLAAESNFEIFAKKAGETCERIALKAKDPEVFNYCVVEMIRPLVRGRSCIAFVAGSNDPGYHCDTKGMLYYETPEV